MPQDPLAEASPRRPRATTLLRIYTKVARQRSLRSSNPRNPRCPKANKASQTELLILIMALTPPTGPLLQLRSTVRRRLDPGPSHRTAVPQALLQRSVPLFKARLHLPTRTTPTRATSITLILQPLEVLRVVLLRLHQRSLPPKRLLVIGTSEPRRPQNACGSGKTRPVLLKRPRPTTRSVSA